MIFKITMEVFRSTLVIEHDRKIPKKWWFSKGNPMKSPNISGISRLVKYYSIWPDKLDVCFFVGGWERGWLM